MDGNSFLNMIWPMTGPYLLAIPRQFTNKEGKLISYHEHASFDTPEEAYAIALDASDSGENVFFALGSVKELILNERGKLGKGNRTHSNIKELRAFWLDIDVKADNKDAYPSQKEAFVALKGFVKAMALPAPYVVSSGAGLHVYWPLTEGLDGDKWFHYASILKQITKTHGLRADPSRTSDRSSILRVPDTMNRKPHRAELPVTVAVTGVITTTEDFLKKLAFIASNKGVAPAAPRKAGSITVDSSVAAANEAAANTFTPPHPLKVIGRCDHLKWQFDNASEVAQSLWYDAIGVLRYCISGEKACHVFSSKDTARYDADAVDAKINQHQAGGYKPTTCAKFEEDGSEQCRTCRWRGKVRSPIALGSVAEEAVAPKMVALVQGEKVETELPPPPFPWRRVMNQSGTHARIVHDLVKEKDGNESTEEITIYDYDVYPYALVYDEAIKGYTASLKHWLPMEGWADMTINLCDVQDERKVKAALGHIGILPTTEENAKKLGSYMRAYIAELQKTVRASVLWSQLGYKGEDKFIAPGKVITAAEITDCEISSNVSLACNEYTGARGTLEEWIEVAKAYEKPECVSLQFSMLTAFAAPLMPLTNFSGAIVAAIGEKGCGKTSASWLGNAAFGHKKMADITDRDTGNALYAKLGTLCNLLITFDEATLLDGETLSSLAYAINQGHGKNRLDRNSQFKERLNWGTLMLMTTNKSPHTVLGALKDDASAEAVRIFQYYVPPNTLTKEFADAIFDKLNYNYGHAGPIYMQEVLRTRQQVIDRIKFWIREVDRLANVTSGERFWSAVPAVVLAAVEITNRLGLTNYDVARLLNFAVTVITAMRVNVVEDTGTSIGTLADYFNTNLRNTLVVGPAAGGTLSGVKHPPSAELRIRVDDAIGRAFLDRVGIRNYCVAKGVDPGSLREELKVMGVLIDDNHKIVLGKGTTFKSAQTRCWEIDMNHHAMTGVAGFVTMSQPTSAAVIPMAGRKVP
jgi:Domain of unknown function (DUF927)